MSAVAARTAPPPLVERLLAPGAEATFRTLLRDWLVDAPRAATILDVAVGTRSLLHELGFEPIGIDVAPRRLRAFQASGGRGVAASAPMLPFTSGAFDVVLCLGLLHHLSDADAAATLAEMRRVTKPSGRLAVFDSALPEPAWRRPLAWAIRRADRGRFVRSAAQLRALLPEPRRWRCTRLTYARTGLEGLWCVSP